MKYLILFWLTLICVACHGQTSTKDVFNSKYCFENTAHSITVEFKSFNDSIAILYYDVIEDGKYLNGYDDTTDYAGKFALEDFRNNQVDVILKSYRNEDISYALNIQLNSRKGWLYWNIKDDGPVPYMVKHATLKKCK